MIHRVREALAWRWRRAVRLRYLQKHFRNGRALAESYRDRTSCEVAVCRDGSVIQHPPDRTGLAGMILEIWFDRVYTRRFYTPATGDVIIDAGANIGLFSLLMARSCPSCRVLAFEPFPENFRALEANLRAAGVSTVQALLAALSGESGEAAIIDGGGRSQDHRLTARTGEALDRPSVRVHSLAEVLRLSGAASVALFKCDIEGSEYDLFAAANREDVKRCRRYAIEYHDNIRPGTLSLLRDRLGPTHTIDIRPAPDGDYGMLYAVAKPAEYL